MLHSCLMALTDCSITFSHVPHLHVSEYIGRAKERGLFLTLPLVYFLPSACSALIPLFPCLPEFLPECLQSSPSVQPTIRREIKG